MTRKINYPARLPGITCPHCDGRTMARTSSQLDPLTRNLRMMCENPDCGHIFVAQIAIYRTLRESMIPRPDIARALPLGDWVAQPANDDDRVPANDDGPIAAEKPPLPG
ncbi:MAG: ogr/Delta-like zinc finger family protein [Sphingomonas pseudosanguinis]|uniref:ogr/Delta-like zinc finger family protein n=1 Tax=Sphingomonas pseudosanguinis TaxID=413712 RepID=UPI00391D4B3A